MSVWGTCEGNEEPQDVVGSLENPEDSQVAHDLLQAVVLHVAQPSKDLDGLIGHKPGSLGGKHFGNGGLQLVVLKVNRYTRVFKIVVFQILYCNKSYGWLIKA